MLRGGTPMDAQKLWTPLVRYDGETWRFPREKMNNGVNIQTAARSCGLRAGGALLPGPSGKRACVSGTGCVILIKLSISGYAGPARETEM